MSIMENRWRAQKPAHVVPADQYKPAPQEPQMLYIGCIDARLSNDEIPLEQGKALIFRNISATVLKNDSKGEKLDPKSISSSGEIPANASMGAALELFLQHNPLPKDKVKHIVVAGHTDCGGLKACAHGKCGEHDYYLPKYLENLSEVRARVMKRAEAEGWDEHKTRHELEEESVRQSIDNLMTYPAVSKAVKEGKLMLHGWVINTATHHISEMNGETKERQFEPLAGKHVARPDMGEEDDCIDKIRRMQAALDDMPKDAAPPQHEPKMLFIGDTDARQDINKDFEIKKGDAIIFRNTGAQVMKQDPNIGAPLEFFITHLPKKPGVAREIVVSVNTDCSALKLCLDENYDKHDHYLPICMQNLKKIRDHVMGEAKKHGWTKEAALQAFEEASVRQSMHNLMSYSVVAEAVKAKEIELFGCVINTATRRIYKMDPETHEFSPFAEKHRARHASGHEKPDIYRS